MTVVNSNDVFTKDIKEVWKLVTDLSHQTWRSDIKKVEILDQANMFVEYTKDGYTTNFIITEFKPYERYEFDIENENIKGHWVGLFEFNDSHTKVKFTEEIFAKKFWMKPFMKNYLKRQQSSYINDLKKALSI